MVRRADQRLKTRQHLIDVTTEVFRDQGVAATRTAEVAASAGISHGTVFIHFATRNDLVTAVVGDFTRRFQERLQVRLARCTILGDALAAHLATIGEDEDLYRRLAAESTILPPDAQAAWNGMQTTVAFLLTPVLERAIAEGAVRPLPLHLLFNAWLGLIHHYLIHRALFVPEGSLVVARGDQLRDDFLSLAAR